MASYLLIPSAYFSGNAIDSVEYGVNVVNEDTTNEGTYIKGSTGELLTNSDLSTSIKFTIPVNKEKIYFSLAAGLGTFGLVAFYDSSNNYISDGSVLANNREYIVRDTVDIPVNAVSVIFGWLSNDYDGHHSYATELGEATFL